MQHDDAVYDRGEFEIFTRQISQPVTPEPDLSDFNDSVWKRFVSEVERERSAEELGIPASPRQRLRSERVDLGPQPESFDGADSPTARQRVAILEYAKRSIAAGESLAEIIKRSEESSPSTATILRQLVSDGEL